MRLRWLGWRDRPNWPVSIERTSTRLQIAVRAAELDVMSSDRDSFEFREVDGTSESPVAGPIMKQWNQERNLPCHLATRKMST
jgi:hypothetical protein